MEIRQYLTEPSVDLQKISRKSTQTKIHIHTDTHTCTYRELRQLPSLPISWFWSWRPLFILMPMARNPIHGSRSLRRLHVSAAGSASAAASAGVAWCCCWRVENQLYVDSAAAVVGNAHLPSAQCVCVCVCVVCMRLCMCAQKKKKQLKKSICKFSTYDSFLLSMPPPLMLFLLLIFLLSPRVSLIRLANYYYQ